jgi:hypothetical protein
MIRSIDADLSKFAFIDLGCGKGKAVLLAGELPFRQIIGVELWPNLVKTATKNWDMYRGGPRKCKSIQLSCMDAVEFDLPPEPSIYYLFSPFPRAVLQRVLDNIRRSLAAAPRELYIIYNDAEFRHLMDNSRFLELIKGNSRYAIYKASQA